MTTRGCTKPHDDSSPRIDEMQVNSCKVYADNDLFGTYDEASKSFEYITYQEYANRVDRCRAVLKDLGT